ncbi:LysM domain-containing protein [Tistrella mobilis]|uniref:LysM domain-containing protein n=1 Tax=Tistrella mobilis TaxID=171437 RepID=UPI0031F70620
MSVATLYDAFVRAAAQGRLDAAILPLMGKLVAVLGVDVLPVTGGRAERLPSTARLTGTSSWADGTGWTLILTGTVDDAGRDQLDLSLEARTTDGFVDLTTLIPDLPSSRVPVPGSNGTVMLGTSVLAGLGPQQATVMAMAVDDGTAAAPRPGLSGTLVLTDTPLAPYAQLLGSTRLALSGVFDPRAEAAIADKVDLLASAPDADTAWSKMNVESLDLVLTTNYVDIYSLEEPQALISAVLLRLVLQVNTGTRHDVAVTVPLLQAESLWDIDGNIDPPLTLSDGIIALLQLFPGTSPDTFSLPPGVAALDAFGLSQLRFGIPNTGGTFPMPTGISFTGATLVSTTAWDVPIPFMRIDQLGASWLVMWDGARPNWTASLFGTMRFGSKTGDGNVPPGDEVTGSNGEPVYLDVVASLPNLSVNAATRGAIEIDLASAMSVFFPGTQPDVDASLIVDRITMSATLPTQTYGATLTAHGTWEIPIGNVTFTLDNVTFEVTVSQARIWGGLSGMIGVNVNGEQATILSAGAYYPGDGSWSFQGGLAVGELNLGEFVYAFLGETPPDWLPDLLLTRLWAAYSTGTGNPYSVSAAVALRWDPEVLGLKLSLIAEADIRRRPKAGTGMAAISDRIRLDGLSRARPQLHAVVLRDAAAGDAPEMIYEGTVKGAFEINNLIVTLGFSFLAQELTWLFRLDLDRFSLEARTSWTGEGAKRHQVLTVEMKGVTLGAMVESFAALANPNANYRLSAPWTFLNDINLGSFTLIIDPTEQSVTLNYAINLTLGFITIKTVGIRYDRKTGEPQVNIEITGNFLGKDYGREPGMSPLAWDALNDSPPAVPGKGNSLVDLRYMGFGQHVTLEGLTRPDSLADVIRLMRAQLRPVDDPNRNPLDQPSGNQLHFQESSQWLIGLDVTLMGTATVKLVMNDPILYGVLIALQGPEAGTLSGFSFELLYKKVTDDIGVFHARLQVPDMFRQLDFGAVAITLGIITVDVFTNGNFKVDLGFPHKRDFSVSFGLQYGPFLGKGGIYFGLLNGATSTRVPAITNGTFSPVLELGLGLAVGVGREFNKGPLKAGLYLQVEVVFEGVLAWFHPDDAAASKAMYYWAQGTAALVGKVYGKVDFKVIGVDVSFEAYASATLTLAAYRPTVIAMSVGVRVHASIKIVFVKFSFSFSTSLDVSFTIGSASTTPWILSADQSGRSLDQRNSAALGGAALGRYAAIGVVPLANASRGAGQRLRRRPGDMARMTRMLTRARLRSDAAHGLTHPIARQMAVLAEAATAIADPCAEGVYRLNFSPDAKVFAETQTLDLRMVPGFTIADMAVAWPGGSTPPAADPARRMVMMLAIDGPVAVDAETLEARRTAAFTATARADDQAETPFALLAEAMFRWAVSALGLDPVTATLTAGDLAELAAQMDCPQTFAEGFGFDNLSGFLGGNVDFHLSGPPSGDDPDPLPGVAFPIPPVLGWTSPDLPPPENDRNFALYQPVDDAYADRIAAYFRQLSPQPAGDGGQPSAGIQPDEPLASVVFREYMLLVAKYMVQAAQGLFTRFPVEIDADTTLAALAGSFPTVQMPYVVHLGDTVAQLAATYGYDTDEILALNPGITEELAAAAPGTVLSVTLGVTPAAIAAANPERLLTPGKTAQVAALETQIRTGDTPDRLCARLGASVDAWLQTAAALDVPAITRAGAPVNLPQGAGVALQGLTITQAAALYYVRLNAGTPAVTLLPETGWYAEAITSLNGDSIGADGSLPAVVKLPSAFDVLTDPVDWTRLAGDTLPLLAAATMLWQNPEVDPAFAAWAAAVAELNPGYAGGPVILPAATTALLPDESLRALAARLLMVADATTIPATPSANFRTVVATTDLLAPLAPVVVTDCRLTTIDNQTLRAFATSYDLAIETTGMVVADVPGVFAVDAALPLIVPDLAAIGLDRLMPALTGDAPVRDVAGQVSRFMLHGQRLPAPQGDDSRLSGLYDLIGQQVTGPAPDTTQPPETVRLTLTVTETVEVPWLTLVATETAPPTEGLAAFTARNTDLAARNPAAAAGRIRPGMILEVDDTTQLVIQVTEKMLEDGYPADTLTPVLSAPPAPLQLWEDVPVRHGLSQMVIWQTPNQINLPALGEGAETASIGMPSFWPFGSDLAAIAAAADGGPWQLYRTDPEKGPDSPALPVHRSIWASLIDIGISRIPGRPNTASVTGADTAGRQLLLELWRYLETHPDDNAVLYFGFRLSPAAGLPGGLTTTGIDRSASYIVRTNLSTETRSGNLSANRLALADGDLPPSSPYFAPVGDAEMFLKLVWEASVVGGGGYWLELTDGDGNGYGDEIWSQEGTATVTVIALLASQSTANPDRQLHSFNTAALVADPVDPAATALFVAAPDDRDQIRQATVAQGNVGFTMGLVNPPDAGDDPDLRARRLYNLAGYQLPETEVFAASNAGSPVGPRVDGSAAAVDRMRMTPRMTADAVDENDQTLSQVIPIHRYAKTPTVPAIPGLPPQAGDPYAGISASGRTAPPVATVVLGFHDVYGNATAEGDA